MLRLTQLFLLFTQLAFAVSTQNVGERTREFDLCISWGKYAPDGFSKYMLLVNGHSPGPVIEVDQDDWVIVRVKNDSPFNTTVHFHGIEMLHTPWSDGVPGLTQRAIKPGHSFQYKFKATQYGSYWYHSHYHAQIEDGLYGPIIIHPRPSDPKPFYLISNDSGAIADMINAERHTKPLVISDLVHLTSEEKWNMTVAAGIEDVCYDSIIFNGKGSAYCLSENEINANISPVQQSYLSQVPGSKLTDKACIPASIVNLIGGGGGNLNAILPGTYSGCKASKGRTEIITTNAPGHSSNWISLEIIGAINFITGIVSIDEHDMWVYAMDGAYIQPQKVQAIVLANGDRYSVLIQKHKVGNFQIRCNAVSAPQIIIGHAVLHVGGSTCVKSNPNSKPFISTGGVPLSKDLVIFDQNTAAPFPPEPIARKADATFKLNMRLDGASYLWALNSSRLMPSMLDDIATPILFHPPDAGKHNNVTISTLNGTWIDLVLFASTSPMPPHPVHKHSTKMFQIGAGNGNFTWASVEEAVKEKPELFNLVNPPRRDAFVTLPAIEEVSWIVVRYRVVNPGAWLLHCHISNHLNGGMSVIIQDGVDVWPKVPAEYLNYGA